VNRGREAQRRGREAEQRAAEFLAARGIEILTCGYRCRLGELDIVGSDGDTLVIVEVRARQRADHGSALESIGPAKRRRIVRATRHFLMRHPAWHSRPIRFDVVAIEGPATEATPHWLRNAFDLS
jgi:putative endonuclease